MSLPSSMVDFVPCDRLLQKAYCNEEDVHVHVKSVVRRWKETPVGIEKTPMEVKSMTFSTPVECSNHKATLQTEKHKLKQQYSNSFL